MARAPWKTGTRYQSPLAHRRRQRQPRSRHVDARVLRFELRIPVDVERRGGGRRLVLADQGRHLDLEQEGVGVEQQAAFLGGEQAGLLELEISVELDGHLGQRGVRPLQLLLERSLGSPRAVANEADEDAGDGDEAGAHRQVGESVQGQRRARDRVVVVDDGGIAQGDGKDGDDGGDTAEAHGRGDGDHEISEEEGRVKAPRDGDPTGDQQGVADGRDITAGQPSGFARKNDDEQGQVVDRPQADQGQQGHE